MNGLQPAEAARALTEIGERQEQVINLRVIPVWYWWAVAALMLVLAVPIDSGDHLAVAIGTSVFALGILATSGWVVLGTLRRAQPRGDLLGPVGALAILGFVAVVPAVSLPAAFALRAAGLRYPATGGVLAGAVLMVVGGPLLMRLLHRVMLANRAGSRR